MNWGEATLKAGRPAGRPPPASRGQMMAMWFRAAAAGGAEKTATDLCSILELECLGLADGLAVGEHEKGNKQRGLLGCWLKQKGGWWCPFT